MRRAVVVALLVVIVHALPVSAAPPANWWFKTPGGAAYCGFDDAGWLCMRPRDGLWIRFIRVFSNNQDFRQGYDERYRGHRGGAVRTLGFGEEFYSSDAEVINCRSQRTGVTCRLSTGLSFTLGRRGGYRIIYGVPGYPLRVHPLFRSTHGIYCGIDSENLEPSNPLMKCWRPADGLVFVMAHPGRNQRTGHGRDEQALRFRPRGFGLLGADATFVWRCRRVTALLAEGCSTRTGEPVFTCSSTRVRLTCRDREGHGFWASARSFYAF